MNRALSSSLGRTPLSPSTYPFHSLSSLPWITINISSHISVTPTALLFSSPFSTSSLLSFPSLRESTLSPFSSSPSLSPSSSLSPYTVDHYYRDRPPYSHDIFSPFPSFTFHRNINIFHRKSPRPSSSSSSRPSSPPSPPSSGYFISSSGRRYSLNLLKKYRFHSAPIVEKPLDNFHDNPSVNVFVEESNGNGNDNGKDESSDNDNEDDAEIKRAQYVTYFVVGLNVFVFWLWNFGSHPKFMLDHFSSSLRNLVGGRLYTLITSSFSHQALFHLMFNAFFIYQLSPQLILFFGVPYYFGLYLLGSISCSLFHIWHVNIYRPPPLQQNQNGHWVFQNDIPAIGASGSVMSLLTFYALIWPHTKILVFGVIPMTMRTMVPLLVLSDFYFAFAPRAKSDGVSHAGHVGGAVVGLAAYLITRGRGKLPKHISQIF